MASLQDMASIHGMASLQVPASARLQQQAATAEFSLAIDMHVIHLE